MTGIAFLSSYGDLALLFLRIAVAATFLAHGFMKRGMWKLQPSPQMSGGMLNMMRFLSIAEPLGGLGVLVGFLTPLAALGLSFVMLGALYFKITVWKSPFASNDKNGWEFDLLLLASNVVLLLFGAGMYSLDQLWFSP